MSDGPTDAGYSTFDFEAALAGIRRSVARQDAQMEQDFRKRVSSGRQKPVWWQQAEPALLILLAMIAFASLVRHQMKHLMTTVRPARATRKI
jgi:hypothetical protein